MKRLRERMVTIRMSEQEWQDLIISVDKLSEYTTINCPSRYFRWLHNRFGTRLANDQELEFGIFAFGGEKRKECIRRSAL